MYLVKGSRVSVEGKIQTRKFDGESGTKYFTEIIADRVVFLDRKSDIVDDVPVEKVDAVPMIDKDYTVEINHDFTADEIPF